MRRGVILVLAALLGEALRLAWLARLPAAPDFLLGITVLVALGRRPPAGAMTGFVLGLFRDFVYGDPLGVETLALTLVGWGAGSLGKSIYREAAITQAVVMLGAGLARGALVYLILTEGEFSGLLPYGVRVALPSAAATAVLVPLIYHFLPQGRPRRLSAHEKRLLLEQQ